MTLCSSIPTMLVVDDEKEPRENVASLFSKPPQYLVDAYEICPFAVETAETAEQARDMLAVRHFDVVVLDLSLPRKAGDVESLEVGKRLLEDIPRFPLTTVVVMTKHASRKNIVRNVLRGGAFDFLSKLDFPTDEQKYQAIARAYQRGQMEREHQWLQASRKREGIRREVELRNQRDSFVNAAAELLTEVALGVDGVTEALQTQFGIDTNDIESHRIVRNLDALQKARVKGSARFAELRDAIKVAWQPATVSPGKVLEEMSSELQIPLAYHHVFMKLGAETSGLPSDVRLFEEEFRDCLLEAILFAAEHAGPNSAIVLTGTCSKRESLDITVTYSLPPDRTEQGCSDLSSNSTLEFLVKAMGGDLRFHQHPEIGSVTTQIRVPLTI